MKQKNQFWALDVNQVCLGMVEANSEQTAKKLLTSKLKKEGIIDEWSRSGYLLNYFDSSLVTKKKT